MGYYDSVKDSVRNKGGSHSNGFKKLREEAEKDNVNGDNDDTPIEILEEGLKERPFQNSGSNSNDVSDGSDSVASSGSGAESEVLDKLDKLIEQNDRIIKVLESFGE